MIDSHTVNIREPSRRLRKGKWRRLLCFLPTIWGLERERASCCFFGRWIRGFVWNVCRSTIGLATVGQLETAFVKWPIKRRDTLTSNLLLSSFVALHYLFYKKKCSIQCESKLKNKGGHAPAGPLRGVATLYAPHSIIEYLIRDKHVDIHWDPINKSS